MHIHLMDASQLETVAQAIDALPEGVIVYCDTQKPVEPRELEVLGCFEKTVDIARTVCPSIKVNAPKDARNVHDPNCEGKVTQFSLGEFTYRVFNEYFPNH